METLDRPVSVRMPPNPVFETRMTKRMQRIDPALLAMARGDADPEALGHIGPPPASRRIPSLPPILSSMPPILAVECVDPYGGLIPVFDDEDVTEVEDDWISNDVEPDPFSR